MRTDGGAALSFTEPLLAPLANVQPDARSLTDSFLVFKCVYSNVTVLQSDVPGWNVGSTLLT